MFIKWYVFLFTGVMTIAGIGIADDLPRRPYRFDAGPADSNLAENAGRLAPEHLFAEDRGFGWLEKPQQAFVRHEEARSRDDFSIDGVAGRRLAFRANLPEGKWWLTLWLESGKEDSSTAAIVLCGESVDPDWHAFAPPAEPRTDLQSSYRLFHGAAQVAQDGFSYEVIAGDDDVRVLGFTLHPDPTPQTAAAEALLQHMHAAGRYGSDASLDAILQDLRNLKDSADNVFASYWIDQVELLQEAETHYELRGWEWARLESGLSIFDRFHQAVMLLDGLLSRDEVADYPFYERALWNRGRLLYWLAAERGGPNELSGSQRDLQILYQRYPEDELLAMYNGEKVDLPDPCDELQASKSAPAWSNAQRELLCRLRNIAHWWVLEQQAENGEFGGKLGDDVELLRWWTPLVMAGDTIALRGWRKLADGVWESPKVYRGYSKAAIDVEHSSEFISDTAPAMAVYSDNPEYTDRLRYSADYFQNLWTGYSESGRRFFRSAWFSSTEVDTEPPKNRDLEYNCRAVKAVRYLVWRTGDAEVVKALHEWSRAWAEISAGTDKGKPAGIIPASVRFPDEAINGDEPTWYRANMYWNYFDWRHHVGSMMMDQLLFTFTLTGDETLLQPMFAALELIKQHTPQKNGSSATPGSPEWTAAHLQRKANFWSVVGQWRLLTGDQEYDELLLRYGTPYLRYRLTGEQSHLVSGLERTLSAVRYNTPLLTSEVLHTDRVYAPGSQHLKAMLTGDGISESASPYFAVSWEGTDDDFTALVTETGPDRLSVDVFMHAVEPDDVTMRFWQLEPGRYKIVIKREAGTVASKTIEIKERGQRATVTLPGHALVTILVRRL